MKNLELILIAMPAVVMFGFTIFMKHIHDGAPRVHAITVGWTYAVLAAGCFIILYLFKFSTNLPLN